MYGDFPCMCTRCGQSRGQKILDPLEVCWSRLFICSQLPGKVQVRLSPAGSYMASPDSAFSLLSVQFSFLT